MKDKLYRAWLRIEEIDESEGYESKLVEQIELATFPSIEEVLTYGYELSQNHSPKATRESEMLNQITSPETFITGD